MSENKGFTRVIPAAYQANILMSNDSRNTKRSHAALNRARHSSCIAQLPARTNRGMGKNRAKSTKSILVGIESELYQFGSLASSYVHNQLRPRTGDQGSGRTDGMNFCRRNQAPGWLVA